MYNNNNREEQFEKVLINMSVFIPEFFGYW